MSTINVVNRKAFFEALNELSFVADPKSVLPILRNVLLETKGDKLQLRSTDLKNDLSCEVDIESTNEMMKCCVPAKALAAIVKPEPKTKVLQNVKLTLTETNFLNVEIENESIQLLTDPAENYPSKSNCIPSDTCKEYATIAYSASEFKKALDHVELAVSHDDTRRHLNAVHLDSENMVSTDGHRMHVAKIKADKMIGESLTIPFKAMAVVSRLLKLKSGSNDLSIELFKANSETNERGYTPEPDMYAKITVKGFTLKARVNEAQFPPYKHIIPNINAPKEFTLNCEALTRGLLRLGKVSQRNETVLTANCSSITFEVEDPDTGSAKITVPCSSFQDDGSIVKVGLDKRYLLDAAKETKSVTVQLDRDSNLSPILVKLDDKPEWLSIIMPVRL
jgi:DNA polymerase III beta subunit